MHVADKKALARRGPALQNQVERKEVKLSASVKERIDSQTAPGDPFVRFLLLALFKSSYYFLVLLQKKTFSIIT